ncbi:MAG: diacylglycerol/lipid kinase family protein [Phycisphaerae bacterium]
MGRRVVAILNPVSGRRDMLPVVRQVGRALESRGARFETLVSNGAGHASRLAAQLNNDVDVVLAVGGDGTVREVVDGVAGRSSGSGVGQSRASDEPLTPPIVILGTGTENLIATELGMPLTPELVVEAVLSDKSIFCDVGVVNGRSFLAVTGVGFDAECVARLALVRRGHITHGDYFGPIWQTFWKHRFPRIRVVVDDCCVFDDRGFAMVGVIGRYAAGLRILSDARYDDGLLDVCAFRCSSRIGLLRHAWRILWRRHTACRDVVYRQGRLVSITSPERVQVEVDGDPGGYLPAQCSVIPRAVRFLAPRIGSTQNASAGRCPKSTHSCSGGGILAAFASSHP